MARVKNYMNHDRHDKQAVIDLARQLGKRFRLQLAADSSLFADRDVIFASVAAHGSNLLYAPPEMQDDYEIVTIAISSHGCALEHCHERFQSDRHMVISALKTCGTSLRWASEELRNDPEIVKLAISSAGEALEYVPPSFADDKETILAALQSDTSINYWSRRNLILMHASQRLRGHRDVVMAAVELCEYQSLQHTSDDLKSDRELVKWAIEANALALAFAAPDLRNDRELVILAVSKQGEALQYASKALQGDYEVVWSALQNPVRGLYSPLLWASEELRSKREIVLEAVKRAGSSFQYARADLQGDREIVEIALQNKNSTCASAIMKWSTPKLRADRKLVRNAIQEDSKTLLFVSRDIQMDPDMVALAWDSIKANHDYKLCHEFDRSEMRSFYLEKIRHLKEPANEVVF